MPKRRKVSPKQLEAMQAEGAVVSRRSAPKAAPEPKPEPEPVVEAVPEPERQVDVDLGIYEKGVAAMAATIQHVERTQAQIAERLTEELVKLNNRTKARIRVTERNEYGGIDTAEIEIID